MWRKGRSAAEGPGWTTRDEVLSYTCTLAAELAAGGPVTSAWEVAAPFPTTLGEELPLWGSGAFTLHEWRAPGDGSWQPNQTIAFGTGAVGAGLTIGSLLGGVIGNSRARRAAEAAATPRWMQTDGGGLYLSHRGFYLDTARVVAWDWTSVTSATMAKPGAVQISGNSEYGPISWALCSDWAELLFITWALTRHPRHPQLIDGQWLPPGWLDHAQAHHQPIRLGSLGLPRAAGRP
ncbi:MAG: hypothetical protein ACREQ5_06295 [Candidatus Dormibacteria bacterium]